MGSKSIHTSFPVSSSTFSSTDDVPPSTRWIADWSRGSRSAASAPLKTEPGVRKAAIREQDGGAGFRDLLGTPLLFGGLRPRG